MNEVTGNNLVFPLVDGGASTRASASLTPQQWHQIEVTRFPSGWLLRLNSLLPPQTDRAEAAWNEHLHSEALAVLQPADLLLDPNLDEDEMLRKIKAVLEEQRSSTL